MSDLHRIGKYELLALIAQGGMGNVYLARAEGLGGFTKLVVIKTLRPDMADDPKFAEMFLDEARLAARLNHRNIVQTNDVGSADGVYFMVMDYLEGRSLWRVQKADAKTSGILPLDASVRVVADMLAGLHHAHELTDFDGKSLGVVHRDVCPANVFITTDGQVKVVDFGVAKAKNHAHETQAGTIKGRVAYMSPEHVIGKTIDRRADVFSAGIMLWEAIEKRRYWEGQGEAQILGALLKGDLPNLPGDACPPMLKSACARALAAAPEDRFRTAHEMRLALEAWLDHNEKRSALTELGQRVKELSTEERARVAQLVEASVSPSMREGALPALEGPANANPESSMASRPRPTKSEMVPSTTAPATASPTLTLSSPLTVPPPQRPMWPFLAAGAVVLLVGSAIVGMRMTSAKPATAEAPVASGASVTALGGPAAPESVRLTVKVTPATAQLFVDEQEVQGNPYSTSFPRGSGKHLVRAVAPGYATKSELVDLTENMQVGLALEPAAAAPGKTVYVPVVKPGSPPSTAGQPVAVAPTPTPTAEPAPPGKTPLRPVDTSNPYGRPTGTGRVVDSNNPYQK
jgi:serine/threonine protein kinase